MWLGYGTWWVRLVVGLDDLEDLFPPTWFYDSMFGEAQGKNQALLCKPLTEGHFERRPVLSAGWCCRNLSTCCILPLEQATLTAVAILFVSGAITQQLYKYIVTRGVPVHPVSTRQGRKTVTQVPLTPSFVRGRLCLKQNVFREGDG